LDDRLIAVQSFMLRREESPGSKGNWQSLTATEGNLRDSATETILPLASAKGKGETSGVRAHSW